MSSDAGLETASAFFLISLMVTPVIIINRRSLSRRIFTKNKLVLTDFVIFITNCLSITSFTKSIV